MIIELGLFAFENPFEQHSIKNMYSYLFFRPPSYIYLMNKLHTLYWKFYQNKLTFFKVWKTLEARTKSTSMRIIILASGENNVRLIQLESLKITLSI